MLLHSTVAGTHFVAAVAVACMFPAVEGIVVVGVAALTPSGTCCLPAIVVVVVDAAFIRGRNQLFFFLFRIFLFSLSSI